ncbi:MAG: hypothetical protein PHS57_03790 [Alphaproteobacteria bacterium]|nr:hypothetical protein [Alphaproteobacteria bacterium]
MTNNISEVTRRSIIDFLTAGNISWSGRLQDNEFLARLYDLGKLPSTDRRFSDAAGDIFQHCVMNSDWNDDWVFYDQRFNLLRSADEEFLRFLCETVHPVVRPSQEQVIKLVEAYNKELAKDGWKIIEANQISGRPVFVPQANGECVQVFDEPTGWQKVDRQLQQAKSTLFSAHSEEDFQTVGLLCRETLISVAQEVFDPACHSISDGVSVSPTDATRMLQAVLDFELKGNANEDARKHAKAAFQLSLALQHKRTADYRMAALCLEATASVTNLIAILFKQKRTSITTNGKDPFRLCVKELFDILSGYDWSKREVDKINQKISLLENSTASVWIDDDLRDTRNTFLSLCKTAMRAREIGGGDYRCSMERKETCMLLKNAAERLEAGLTGKALPPWFDPFV